MSPVLLNPVAKRRVGEVACSCSPLSESRKHGKMAQLQFDHGRRKRILYFLLIADQRAWQQRAADLAAREDNGAVIR